MIKKETRLALRKFILAFSMFVEGKWGEKKQGTKYRPWEMASRKVVETDDLKIDADKPVVCWGDSMTKGSGAKFSYPMILESLTKRKTYNFGVSGATSEEIAIMAGGLAPLKPLDSYRRINMDFMEEYSKLRPDILILEIGSNGGWNGDYKILIEQYKSIIEQAGCEKYIIVGDTDDPINSADPKVRELAKNSGKSAINSKTGETSWDEALKNEFGDHFFNTRLYILKNGHKMLKWKSTSFERAEARRGNLSPRIRFDWTHFNNAGYYVKAIGIYEKGKNLGYW